jgi:hypothetical protein
VTVATEETGAEDAAGARRMGERAMTNNNDVMSGRDLNLPVHEDVYTLVTPEMARRWLDHNDPNNRRVSDRTVDAYWRLMAANKWYPEIGEAIAFDPADVLLNGQHRLCAVVKLGRPICLRVVRGVSREAMPYFDGGHTRRASFRLSLSGTVPEPRNVAAWCAIYQMLLNGSLKTTSHDVEEYYRQNRGAVDAMLAIVPSKQRGPLSWASLGGSLVFAYDAHPAKVASFARDVYSGANLRSGSPAHTLRERILNTPAGAVSGHNGRRDFAVKVLYAAAAHIDGRSITRLQINEDVVTRFAAGRVSNRR